MKTETTQPPKNEPLTLENPRVCVVPDGDVLRVLLQDPDTKADLVVVNLRRELARVLADEFRSVQR